MVRDNLAKQVWYNLEQTLRNLDFIHPKISITPAALQNFLVSNCPGLMIWEFDSYWDDQDVAMAEKQLDQTNAEWCLHQTCMRLFNG